MKVVCRTRLCPAHYEEFMSRPWLIIPPVKEAPPNTWCGEDMCENKARWEITFILRVVSA